MPYSQTIEFFLDLFDLIGNVLFEVVEESRCKGKVSGALHSTFIALIPKNACPFSLNDFRKISLCNLRNKITEKVIVSQIKGVLSACMSSEYFGFL